MESVKKQKVECGGFEKNTNREESSGEDMGH